MYVIYTREAAIEETEGEKGTVEARVNRTW